MEKKKVKLDENWITPAALAAMLGISRNTVSTWISRNKIDYFKIPGAIRKAHLVDQRTAPAVKPVGRPPKKKSKTPKNTHKPLL